MGDHSRSVSGSRVKQALRQKRVLTNKLELEKRDYTVSVGTTDRPLNRKERRALKAKPKGELPSRGLS